jgi:hypothetical protein
MKGATTREKQEHKERQCEERQREEQQHEEQQREERQLVKNNTRGTHEEQQP